MARQARGRAKAPSGDFVVSSGDQFVVVRLHVRPGAGADAIIGPDPWRGSLVVQVRARAQQGEANSAVIAVVAAALGVRPRDVVIEHGATSREKTVRVVGVDAAYLRARVGASP